MRYPGETNGRDQRLVRKTERPGNHPTSHVWCSPATDAVISMVPMALTPMSADVQTAMAVSPVSTSIKENLHKRARRDRSTKLRIAQRAIHGPKTKS
jgi:hypothetical protein